MKNTLKITGFSVIILLLAMTASACRRHPEPVVRTISDIEGKTIGVLSGTVSEIYAEKYGTVRIYDSAQTMTGDLAAGVIDCAFADKNIASAYVKLNRRLRMLSDPVEKDDYRIAAAPESRDMITDMNTVLETLITDGTLQLLEGKYIRGEEVQLPQFPALDAYGESLRLAVPINGYPPYSIMNSDEEYSGFDIDLARYICGNLGVNLVIIPMEYAKMLDSVRFGRADFAMGGITDSSAEPGEAEFSSVYTVVEMAVITRK